MATSQSCLAHFESEGSAVIDDETWTYYIWLRRFGRCLEALKARCAAYSRHREPVREQLIRIARSKYYVFQSWMTSIDPHLKWAQWTPATGDSSEGFSIATDWKQAQVAVLQDESELRLDYMEVDSPNSPSTGHWGAILKVDIFERDMSTFAEEWIQARL